jgi:hypothetical protein
MKIGIYSIPRFRLPKLIDATRKIYDGIKGNEVEPEVVAHLLGLSPASGGFKQKLADLRSYGLITGRGKVKVTELGKKITYPDSEHDKYEAHVQLLRNIPLWNEIYEKYGVSIPRSNFWVDLSKITGVEAPEAKNKEDLIRKAYMDDVKYLKPVEKPISLSKGEAIGRRLETMEVGIEKVPQAPSSVEELRMGDIRIWLPKANIQSAIRKAKKLLAIYEEEEIKPAEVEDSEDSENKG